MDSHHNSSEKWRGTYYSIIALYEPVVAGAKYDFAGYNFYIKKQV
jgi:hypothetical protein